MLYYDFYGSPLGTLLLTGSGGALTGLTFSDAAPRNACRAQGNELASARTWLDDYFRGETGMPDLAMAPEGTAFQQLVWKLLLEIPFGETVTYGDLARKAADILGKEKMLAQAVGQAVGRNPIAIMIPCHRVVGAGGKLTGYAYGQEKKKWLLRHEQK